ncbi:hypothetical protein PAHAL_1G160600 [Panicum hallii]|jgi:hypothetical protein|uniref:NAC domain-containing protein n=1 Tax=Panicum hallii TaxID=206008 RepID=A0A2T8KVE2_9POAL|nr:hypothetical protein PAHAL_1G160600 [Panicum hallii]
MSAAKALGLPPGVRFDPTGDELVEFYLLPRALGRPPAVPGIIIEDAAAATTSASHPWKLLTRHRRTDDGAAYFFERASSSDDAKVGARQYRSCGSRWKWVGQRRWPDEALPPRGGEQVSWRKCALNLQEGRRKSGSTGWVLHEYTVASPQCPFPVKLCHVAFTGYGYKRQRVPDGGEGEAQELEPQAAPPPHKRAAATASSVITTATLDQEDLGEVRHRAQDQEQQFLDYGTSSVGDFCGSDAGFSQESSVLDPWCPDAGPSQQEPFALDQELAQNQECFTNQSQEQFVNHEGSSIEAYCALLLAPDLRSSQEPPAGQSLTEEQQLQLQLAQLLGGINSPRGPPTAPAGGEAAYHEEHIQTTSDLPLPTDQESCTTEKPDGNMGQDDFFEGWGDLDSFCDTTGVQTDDDEMAAGSPERLPAMVVEVQPVAGAKSEVKCDLDRHFLDQQTEIF